MDEIVDCDKVISVLLEHGEWYEVDSGTFTSIPDVHFLSGHPRINAFAWKSHGANLACPCSSLILVRYST